MTTHDPLRVFLAFDEAEEFRLRAAARGVRATELMRELALAYLRGEGSTAAAPAWHPPAEAADLAAAAASIERTARMLLEALPAVQAMAEERVDVRRTLAEIAGAIGTLAGAVEALPPATDTGRATEG